MLAYCSMFEVESKTRRKLFIENIIVRIIVIVCFQQLRTSFLNSISQRVTHIETSVFDIRSRMCFQLFLVYLTL